nr:hypothetical protein CPGR_01609 [Mycolicibacter nonchromogenicus]
MRPSLDALRWELVDHLDAMPFDCWSPEMLEATVALLKAAGVKPQRFVGKPKLVVLQGDA